MKKLFFLLGLCVAALLFGRATVGAEEITAEFPELSAEQAAARTDGKYGTVYKSEELS